MDPITAFDDGDAAPRAAGSEPFAASTSVPVAGGALHVPRSGPPPASADVVVLAVHGVTGSHMAWRAVARALACNAGVCVLAPDLRGRGRSATLPGPYGLGAHLADLAALLDHAGVRRAIVVGHSMGAHVASRFAAEHPGRASGVVLIDGGLPLAAPLCEIDDDLEEMAAPAIERMEEDFASVDEYVAGWRAHPAFRRAWNDDVDAYARYEAVSDGSAVRCGVSEHAVLVDGVELLADGTSRSPLARLEVPVHLMRAERGLFDDDNPAIPEPYLRSFAADHPHITVEEVADVNHYTLLLGDSPGPARVAAAIELAASAA
jgi:pimeloyl-ACP methyl ester carboxylesterase